METIGLAIKEKQWKTLVHKEKKSKIYIPLKEDLSHLIIRK